MPDSSNVTLVGSATDGGKLSTYRTVHLPYISPEQTGRMNRMVDYRTDFYSLGVVFYELLTGTPPFTTEDTLEMIHCHIAKRPNPPHECHGEIPEQISAIVMRLLEKNAEDRYQSASGLQYDLKRCAEQLNKHGRIEQFVLGEHDFSGTLHIPQTLYGRDKEIRRLLSIFDTVVEGDAKLCLVAGFSGVGAARQRIGAEKSFVWAANAS